MVAKPQLCVVVEHPVGGLVVALPRDPSLDPGLAVGYGDLDHLQAAMKQLGGAAHGGAVEHESAVDRALRVQAIRVRDVDLAAPR